MHRYLIRNDLPAYYQSEVDALAHVIEQHTDFQVDQVLARGQISQFSVLDFGLPVISLDKRMKAEHNLQVSRLFHSYYLKDDDQSSPIDITARPGYPSLKEQAEQIPAGEYVLVDDDSASGFTLDKVEALLRSYGVLIKHVHLLSSHHVEGYEDIIDASDFIASSDYEGGLVTLLGQVVERRDYLSMDVNLVTRATLPNSLKETIRYALAHAKLKNPNLSRSFLRLR